MKLILIATLLLLGVVLASCQQDQQSSSTTASQSNDLKLPSNCSSSLSVVFPAEILLQAYLGGDTSNFTALYINVMIASHKQGAFLTQYAISNYASNSQLVSLLQQLNQNMTQMETQLSSLLTSLQLENLPDIQKLAYGDDCALRAASTDNLRGPCDFIFIMIHRMAMTKVINLLAISEGDINQQIGDMAYNELVNSSNNIEKLLQIAKASNCYNQ